MSVAHSLAIAGIIVSIMVPSSAFILYLVVERYRRKNQNKQDKQDS